GQSAPVAHRDGQPRHAEGRLPGAGTGLLVRKGGSGPENLRVGPVAHPCSGAALGDRAHNVELACLGEGTELGGGTGLTVIGEVAGFAAVKGHAVGLAAAIDLDVETLGQSVDDRGAYPVQPAGSGVGATPELPAGVQS